MPTTTRRDLAEILAAELGLKKIQARRCTDTFFQALTEAIVEGCRVEVRGFGAFEVKETRPRGARNPKTGEPAHVPARRKVMFRPGKALKAALGRPKEGVQNRSRT